ncbi:MAG: hypothetical protein EP343_25830 [Deltaproteobacteria bacterium]|nr:MAG: hypothetical protein EP343_25830 [Deltaproteobacteria bacterium]
MLRNAAPFWWMGAGLITASLATLFRYREKRSLHATSNEETKTFLNERWRQRLMDVLCLSALAVIVALMLPEVTQGLRPINKDHTVHFVKAWQLQDAFLGQGRLWGWSHQWFAGYPAQYLYPIGSDLFTLFVRGLSFGFLNLEQAYAAAFWLHFLVVGYGVFRCASRGYSRTVGLLAAVLFLTDIGSFRMGGWVFTAQWGVWPMSLSLGFGLLAISHLNDVLTSTSWRSVAWFGLWMGLALLVHPIQLIHFGVVLPVAIVVRWLVKGGKGWLLAMGRVLLGGSIGLSLGGLWLFPFFSTQNYAQSYGAPWWDTFRMGKGIYTLDLLQGTWPAILAFGVVGLFVMLFSRRFFPLLFGLLSFTLLLTSSSSFLQGFHLIDFLKSLQNIQFQRFAVLLKPYLFIACAVSVVVLFKHLAKQGKNEDEQETGDAPTEQEQPKENLEQGAQEVEASWNPWPVFVRYLLVGFLAAPVLYPLVSHYMERHVKHIYRRNIKDDLETDKDDKYRIEKKAFVNWALQQFPQDRKRGFFRLALYVGKHTHSFFDLGPKLQVPIYKIGFTPSTNFRYKMDKDSSTMLQALNVLYLLSRWQLSSKKYELVKRIGQLYVYRFKGYQPNPFQVLAGQGSVQLKTFSDEDIVLVAGPGSQGQLRLNVSYFPRWSATHNGSPLPLLLTQVNGSKQTGFMTVPLKPGTYHFRFRRGMVEWLSLGVFVLGIAFLFGLFWADSLSNRVVWLKESLGSFQDSLTGWETRYAYVIRMVLMCGILIVAGVGIGLALWNPGQRYKHPLLRAHRYTLGFPFLSKFKKATAYRGYQRKECRRTLNRLICGPQDWQHLYVKQVRLGNNEWKQCIWMHPQRQTPVVLQYKNVVVGDLMTGYFGIAKTGFRKHAPSVTFQVRINGKRSYTGKTRDDSKRSPFRINLPTTLRNKPVTVEFQVNAHDTGKRHFCFHAQGIKLP